MEPVLCSQSNDILKLTFKSRLPVNTGPFTIKMFIWDHKTLMFKDGYCLREVAANTGLTIGLLERNIFQGLRNHRTLSSQGNFVPALLSGHDKCSPDKMLLTHLR